MERFKKLSDITKADSRMANKAIVNRKTGKKVRKFSRKDHYASVGGYSLSKKVPDEIVSQFNISKNVLLYAYFSYSLHTVAAQHVLSTLEFAMRNRIGDEELKKMRRKGIHSYVKYIIDQGWIKNEDFRAYHEAPFLKAKSEYKQRKSLEMDALGLDEIQLDFDEVEVPESNNCDHLATIQKNLNQIRNEFAHGTTTLYPYFTYKLFNTTVEFINALFDENHKPDVDLTQILKGTCTLKKVGRAST